MAAFSFGGEPPPAVAAYFRDKTLRPAFRWTEVWGEEHAYAFTVAKAEQLEVLGAVKAAVQRAIDEGVPFERFAKDLQPALEKQGWWGRRPMTDPATGQPRPVQLGSRRRLKTIFDANLRSARAAGQWERAQRTKAVLPFLVYELGPSVEHRPEHAAKQGVILPVDHPFWDAWFPPNGWGCKCWVRQITRGEAERRGGVSSDPEIPEREFVRTRDDGRQERVRVPEGIDPGWAGNPGRNRAKTLVDALSERLEASGPDAAREAVADLWAGPNADLLPRLAAQPGRAAPERFYAPVAVSTPALREAAEANAPLVLVSSDQMAAKLADKGGPDRGRPLLPADFGRVQTLVDQGVLLPSGRLRSRVLLHEFPDGWWRLVLKADARGGLFVSTLFPVREADALRALKGG